jgi:hypothetical protein
LAEIRNYLEHLSAWRKKAEANADLEIDFPAKGWEKARIPRDNAKTDYIRRVFDICTRQAKSPSWSELGLEMKDKVLRFEVLAEDEWEAKLNEILTESTG